MADKACIHLLAGHLRIEQQRALHHAQSGHWAAGEREFHALVSDPAEVPEVAVIIQSVIRLFDAEHAPDQRESLGERPAKPRVDLPRVDGWGRLVAVHGDGGCHVAFLKAATRACVQGDSLGQADRHRCVEQQRRVARFRQGA